MCLSVGTMVTYRFHKSGKELNVGLELLCSFFKRFIVWGGNKETVLYTQGFGCSLVFLITHLFVLSLAVEYMTFAHQRAEIAELWPLLNAPTVGQTGCCCSSSPQVNCSRLSSTTACETGPDSGSCVCSSGKNGSVNPWRWVGSNEPQRAQSQTRLTRFWSYSCQLPRTLTLRVLALEVTDEADVFLHPIKGSQLQSISNHLHRLLQQLETERKRR